MNLPAAENSIRVTQETAGQNSTADDPPVRVGRISYVSGKVYFLRSGVDQWTQAEINFPITTGDRLYTDRDARAEVEAGWSTARLSENTDLTITNLNDHETQLGLSQGTLRLSVYALPSGSNLEVDTQNGALTVVQPGKFRIETNADGTSTVVVVNSGALQVAGGDVSQTVQAGQAVRLSGQEQISMDSIPVPSPDSFDRWSDQRDKHRSDSASSRYVSSLIPGYDDLDQYGRWQDVADYGPVWFPSVAADWVPYRDGIWMWVDPWGWTWVEEETWGFATFHYGRWVIVGTSWGWIPGPILPLPVYAPAFVAFVGGPGFALGVGVDFVGWFPLGPDEPFFPWYHYSFEYLRIVNITNIRNVTNIDRIINVRDINSVHYRYRTIATTAVPREAFSSGEPVKKHVIRLTPQQLAKAQVVPHPAVNPTPRAVTPGKPVPAPPVRPISKVPSAEVRAPARRPPPSAAVPPPSVSAPPHPGAAVPLHTLPAKIITHAVPPPPVVPFEVRRRAMADHPGRPLEPLQVEHLRAGVPVGPMHDREFPPHVTPVMPERVVPMPSPHPKK
jgi:hypothetical protein